jgi:hypothetical protein
MTWPVPGRASALASRDAGDRPQGTATPRAQLRFTDIGGHRFACFATNAKGGQLADLELRHRRRARCEDRIRAAKDTGPRNLPFHGFTQNQIRGNGVRAAGLDPDVRPARPGPALGTQMAAAAPVQRGRAHRLHRQAPAAAHRNTLAMGQPHHRSDPPASGPHPGRTTPATQEGEPRDYGTPPARRDSRAATLTSHQKTAASVSIKPQQQDHERSRLVRSCAELVGLRVESVSLFVGRGHGDLIAVYGD